MAAPKEENQRVPKFNKKRKKSFLSNARGMGKKGKFGHGTQMDEDTYNYFVRVLELLKGDFDSPQERESLVLNALSQTEDNEVNLSSNQVGCRVIEQLIRLAPPASLKPFMNVFLPKLRVVATDRFASHVVQGLVAAVTKVGLDGSKNSSHDTKSADESEGGLSSEEALNWIVKVAKFILNNLDEFLWDEYANYVIRTVLQCLSGSPPDVTDSYWSSDPRKQSSFPVAQPIQIEDDNEQPGIELPDCFGDVLKSFYTHISSLPQFTDLAYTNSTSALLQALITALSRSHPKLKKKLIKQLIDQAFCVKNEGDTKQKDQDQKSEVPPVFSSDASVRLLEAALGSASSKYITQMYAMYFMGRIVDLATDLSTNFCVQRLLSCVADKSEFETIFEELVVGMENVIASGKTGVVLALCQACKRLSAKQGHFIEHLMKALNCYEPAERRNMVAPLCMKLCTFEDFKTQQADSSPQTTSKDGVKKSKLNLHGSLIVQTLLKFSKPIKIVNSLLEMPSSELQAVMCDTKGSHIMDAFVKSEFVGEKSRERLFYKLQGSYVAMACSKHGSRALEALYGASNQKNQMKIMEELSRREALITATDTGRIIASKWSLDLFRRSRNEWLQVNSRKERTKDMFADIIGPLASKQ